MPLLIDLGQVQAVLDTRHGEADRAFDNAEALLNATKDNAKREQHKQTMRTQDAIMVALNDVSKKVNGLTVYDDKPTKTT